MAAPGTFRNPANPYRSVVGPTWQRPPSAYPYGSNGPPPPARLGGGVLTASNGPFNDAPPNPAAPLMQNRFSGGPPPPANLYGATIGSGGGPPPPAVLPQSGGGGGGGGGGGSMGEHFNQRYNQDTQQWEPVTISAESGDTNPTPNANPGMGTIDQFQKWGQKGMNTFEAREASAAPPSQEDFNRMIGMDHFAYGSPPAAHVRTAIVGDPQEDGGPNPELVTSASPIHVMPLKGHGGPPPPAVLGGARPLSPGPPPPARLGGVPMLAYGNGPPPATLSNPILQTRGADSSGVDDGSNPDVLKTSGDQHQLFDDHGNFIGSSVGMIPGTPWVPKGGPPPPANLPAGLDNSGSGTVPAATPPPSGDPAWPNTPGLGASAPRGDVPSTVPVVTGSLTDIFRGKGSSSTPPPPAVAPTVQGPVRPGFNPADTAGVALARSQVHENWGDTHPDNGPQFTPEQEQQILDSTVSNMAPVPALNSYVPNQPPPPPTLTGAPPVSSTYSGGPPPPANLGGQSPGTATVSSATPPQTQTLALPFMMNGTVRNTNAPTSTPQNSGAPPPANLNAPPPVMAGGPPPPARAMPKGANVPPPQPMRPRPINNVAAPENDPLQRYRAAINPAREQRMITRIARSPAGMRMVEQQEMQRRAAAQQRNFEIDKANQENSLNVAKANAEEAYRTAEQQHWNNTEVELHEHHTKLETARDQQEYDRENKALVVTQDKQQKMAAAMAILKYRISNATDPKDVQFYQMLTGLRAPESINTELKKYDDSKAKELTPPVIKTDPATHITTVQGMHTQVRGDKSVSYSPVTDPTTGKLMRFNHTTGEMDEVPLKGTAPAPGSGAPAPAGAPPGNTVAQTPLQRSQALLAKKPTP